MMIDDDDLLRAEVIQALMCYDELVFDDFDAQHNVDFREYFGSEIKRLQPLAEDDLITLETDAIRITAKGRLLLRNIAMVFDRHINAAENDNRFSRAI
jgi:oxygen-independent coproporphyrinogen-3 oxidase